MSNLHSGRNFDENFGFEGCTNFTRRDCVAIKRRQQVSVALLEEKPRDFLTPALLHRRIVQVDFLDVAERRELLRRQISHDVRRQVQHVKLWEDAEVGNLVQAVVGDAENLQRGFDGLLDLLNRFEAAISEGIVGEVKIAEQREVEDLRGHFQQSVARQVQCLKVRQHRERIVLDAVDHVVENVQKLQICDARERLASQLSDSVLRYIQNLRRRKKERQTARNAPT